MDNGKTMRKRCRFCYNNGKKRTKYVIYGCPDCPGFPGLCLNCFGKFHKYKAKISIHGVETVLPDWISIYFVKHGSKEMQCNLCEEILILDENSPGLLVHMQIKHKEVYDLHKDNPEAAVGFRIEFLNLNETADDSKVGQDVILSEVCEGVIQEQEDDGSKDKEMDADLQYVLVDQRKKQRKDNSGTRSKRSWVWKYFDKLSNIIYRCRLCDVVLSIKGFNSNNMNRHIRTRHPMVFKSEATKKENRDSVKAMLACEDTNAPYAIKTEEIYASELDVNEALGNTKQETPTSQKMRRSWVWSYFERLSATQAQCKLCKRQISHGGNATGNMNRHLKMIHHKTALTMDHSWVWKVFDSSGDEDFFSCKICQHKCMKYADMEKSMTCILGHLKTEHGVVSGDQIITGTDIECDEN